MTRIRNKQDTNTRVADEAKSDRKNLQGTREQTPPNLVSRTRLWRASWGGLVRFDLFYVH